MPERVPADTDVSGPLAGLATGALRKAIRSQAGAARAYVRKLRENHPDESPARIRERLEHLHLVEGTVSGETILRRRPTRM